MFDLPKKRKKIFVNKMPRLRGDHLEVGHHLPN